MSVVLFFLSFFLLFGLNRVSSDIVDDFIHGFDWPSGFPTVPLATNLASVSNNTMPLFNQTYTIPSIFEFQNTPSAVYQSTTQNVTSIEDFVNFYGSYHVNGFCCLPVFGFSLGLTQTKIYDDVANQLQYDSQLVVVAVTQLSFFALAMWPPEVTGWQIPQLQTIDPNDHNATTQFFQTYGTHYNQKVGFGVEVVYVISVNLSMIAQFDYYWQQNQLTLLIRITDWNIGLKQSLHFQNSQSQLDVHFAAAASLTVYVNGNPIDPDVLTTEVLNGFAVSQPAPVFSLRRSLSDFFYTLNQTQIESWQAALQLYLNQQPKAFKNNILGGSGGSGDNGAYDNAFVRDLYQQRRERQQERHKQLQLFVFLFPIIQQLQQQGGQNLKGTFPYGHPPAPGADFVGTTFDVTSLQSNVLRVSPNTYYLPRFWQSPLHSNVIFQVPDHMAVGTTDEACLLTGVDTAFDEEALISNYHSFTHSSSWFGLARSSHEVQQFQERFFVHNQSLVINETCNTVYEIQVFPPYLQRDLHPSFLKMLGQLPSTYSSDPTSSSYAAFQRFLSFVGTHYVTQATMGATAKAMMWFDNCFLSTSSKQTVIDMSSSCFIVYYEGGGYVNITSVNNTLVSEFTEYYVELHGGNSVLYRLSDDASRQAWINSILDHLVAIDQQLLTIDSLITWDANLQKNVQAAITDYLNVAQKNGQLRAQNFIPPTQQPPSWCT